MYRIKVIIDTSAEKLIAAFENSDDITKWNTTLSKHQILKKFDNTNATISYQVTRVQKPRYFNKYFINLKKKKKINNYLAHWIQQPIPKLFSFTALVVSLDLIKVIISKKVSENSRTRKIYWNFYLLLYYKTL